MLMRPLVVGMSGKAGSGKDLACTILRTKLLGVGIKNVFILRIAAPLKDIVKRDFFFTDEQIEGYKKDQPTMFKSPDTGNPLTPRDIMIAVGRFYRGFDANFWIRRLFSSVYGSIDGNSVVLVPDVRFKNEADFIRRSEGLVIRLERTPEFCRKGAFVTDPSETELDTYKLFDHVVQKEDNINAAVLTDSLVRCVLPLIVGALEDR